MIKRPAAAICPLKVVVIPTQMLLPHEGLHRIAAFVLAEEAALADAGAIAEDVALVLGGAGAAGVAMTLRHGCVSLKVLCCVFAICSSVRVPVVVRKSVATIINSKRLKRNTRNKNCSK